MRYTAFLATVAASALTAGVAAVADLALALKSLNLEADHAAFHRDHFGRGPHGRPYRRGAEMADIDLGTDRNPTRLKTAPDGID